MFLEILNLINVIIIIIIIIKIFVSRLNCTYNYENISELTKRHRSQKSVKF